MYGRLKLPDVVVKFYREMTGMDLSNVHYKSCDEGLMPFKKQGLLGYYDEEKDCIFIDTYLIYSTNNQSRFIPTLIHECMHMIQLKYNKSILFDLNEYRDKFISFKELAIIAKEEGDFVKFLDIDYSRINLIEKIKMRMQCSSEDFTENFVAEIEANIMEIVFMWKNFDIPQLYELYISNMLPVLDTDRYKFVEKGFKKLFPNFYEDLNKSMLTIKDIEALKKTVR